MDMLNKLTNLFQQALETREPAVNLAESFVDHWKGITNYYIETTDESRPVKDTDIPWRLKQMLDILVYEEGEQQQPQEMGPCMEYLLQHKLLETLCTLGKAQYPPGMKQQVLLFFTRVLTHIQKPLLHIITVYRPVQKLIALCGLPGSDTEREESQFLFVVCSRVKRNPDVLTYILELQRESEPHRVVPGSDVEQGGAELPNPLLAPTAPTTPSTPPGLLQALTHLSHSQKDRLVLRAMESVLLLVSVHEEETGVLLAQHTPLCQLLTHTLCQRYSHIPSRLEPAHTLNLPRVHWRTQCSRPEGNVLDGSRSEGLGQFLCWWDYCQELINEAPQVLAERLVCEIRGRWLQGELQPALLQMSEVGVLSHTALLCCVVRHTHSVVLLGELVTFLLGTDTQPEQSTDTHTHTLRYHLIQHCDHISDEISIATLRLFEELLQKPNRNILSNLVLRNLEQRSYRLAPSGGGEERQGVEPEPLDESEELEEDPFFTDMVSDSEFSGPRPLPMPRPLDTPPSSHTHVADIVNSFLCLVPQEAKSSQHLQDAGYDTYVHDAHAMQRECRALAEGWAWPSTLPEPQGVAGGVFYEGHFLCVLFNRIQRILEQPYELNLQVTALLSRLSGFPHPLLQEFLCDPYVTLSPSARSLFSSLVRVIGELMQRIQHIPECTARLVVMRKQLMGQQEETVTDHATLLKGVIVLEEFCKELAAIAFVRLPLEES